ncbi:MAG: DMT family transporter [Proteobacteria bacterium]|nr:DMT family transporter [Pseudomonadota bacterium]MBI3497550.1 DMT family transporter [Pseudomonadota bacterium]
MLSAVLTFNLLDSSAKWLTGGYPVAMVVWSRYVFSVLLMLAAVPWLGGLSALRTRRPAMQAVRGVLLLACTILFMTAIAYIPLATATAIGFASPLFVTALSIPLLGERVGPRRWAAVLAGFAGVVIVIRPGLGSVHWATVLPLLMAICYAAYQILTRMLRVSEGPFASLFYPALLGALLASAAVPFFWVTPRWPDLGLMALMGLFGGTGHFIMIRAFALAPVSTLAPFAYCQIIGAAGLGYAIFGDLPDWPTGVGTAVIVASGIYVWHREAVLRGAARQS